MEFPIVWFLLPYLALLIVVLVIAAINLYHILRFGAFDLRNRIMVIGYATLTMLVLGAAAGYLVGVDWSQVVGAQLPEIQTPQLPLP